jgi:hypothetical protein
MLVGLSPLLNIGVIKDLAPFKRNASKKFVNRYGDICQYDGNINIDMRNLSSILKKELLKLEIFMIDGDVPCLARSLPFLC